MTKLDSDVPMEVHRRPEKNICGLTMFFLARGNQRTPIFDVNVVIDHVYCDIVFTVKPLYGLNVVNK